MKNFKNITSVVKTGLCTGCGTCVAVCPSKAISMVIDKKKMTFQPDICKDTCNLCSLCIRACPGYGIDLPQFNHSLFNKQPEDQRLGHYTAILTGRCTKAEILVGAASGGGVSGLLIYALEHGIIDGALVTRMRKNDPFVPESFIAKTKEEILSARKSLYCPVNLGASLPLLSSSGRYAVVGLPCHIHGIRKAQVILPYLRNNIKLVIGIFCSNTRNFQATRNIISQSGIDYSKIKKIEYRSDQWSVDMVLHMINGGREVINKYYSTKEFGPFINYRCTLCCDQTGELSDISFGDAWHHHSSNTEGESIILVRSSFASDLVRDAEEEGLFDLKLATTNDAVSSQGGLTYKKEWIGARYFWVSLIGRCTPSFNISFPSVRYTDYLRALNFYVTNFIIFRKKSLKKGFSLLRIFQKLFWR